MRSTDSLRRLSSWQKVFALSGMLAFCWVAFFEYLFRPFFSPWKQLVVALLLVLLLLKYGRLLFIGEHRHLFCLLPSLVRLCWRMLLVVLTCLAAGLFWSVAVQRLPLQSTVLVLISYASPLLIATWFMLHRPILAWLTRNPKVLWFYAAVVFLSCIGLALDKAFGTFTWVIPGNDQQFSFWTSELIDPAQVRQGFFFGPANTVVYPLMLFFALSVPILGGLSPLLFLLVVVSLVYATQSANAVLFCLTYALVLVLRQTFLRRVRSTVPKRSFLVILIAILLASLIYSIDVVVSDLPQVQRIQSNLETSAEVEDDASRVNIWQRSFDQYLEYPPEFQLFGMGYGTATTRTHSLIASSLDEDLKQLEHGESSYLQALGEAGLLGLIVRSAPLALALYASFQPCINSFVRDSSFSYIIALYAANTFAPHMESFQVLAPLGFALALNLCNSVGYHGFQESKKSTFLSPV